MEFITEDMNTWKVELTIGRETLAKVKIQRTIFQRDTVSSLLM